MKHASIFLGVLLLLLSGCQGISPLQTGSLPAETESPDSASPVTGGTLTICDTRTVDVLGVPAAMTSGSHIRHSAPALETLFQLDAQGNILPKLAVSYSASVEEKKVVLTLREGVRFHDGTDFDAAAVQWNLEQQMAASATGMSYIDRFQIPDPYTLEIYLSQWDNTLLVSLCQVQGLMISPSAYEENGEEWAASHPVGTGPFCFAGRDPDGTITYVRNMDYWQEGKPYLDSIVIVCDNDSSSREYKFRNGTYDVLIRGDITSLAGYSAEGFTIQSIASTGPWGLIFDSANPDSPFANLLVRQAVCHAIDKEYLIQNVYLDTVIETNQYATPGMDTYNPEVEGYEYNLTLARELLREAGYPQGFTTVFSYDQSADNADALANALQQMLAQIQITLQLNPVSNQQSTYMLQEGGGWEGIMGTFGSAQYDTLTQLYNYMIGEGKYVSMDKPEDLTSNIRRAINAHETDALAYVLETQKLLVDQYCLCYYLFANTDYTVLSRSVHDTGFSSIMPVTMWTPADAWIETEAKE